MQTQRKELGRYLFWRPLPYLPESQSVHTQAISYEVRREILSTKESILETYNTKTPKPTQVHPVTVCLLSQR